MHEYKKEDGANKIFNNLIEKTEKVIQDAITSGELKTYK
jgi:hypothetical protein